MAAAVSCSMKTWVVPASVTAPLRTPYGMNRVDSGHAVIGSDDEVGPVQDACLAVRRIQIPQQAIEALHKESGGFDLGPGEVAQHIGLREIDHENAWVMDSLEGPEGVFHGPGVLAALFHCWTAAPKPAVRGGMGTSQCGLLMAPGGGR